MVDLTPEQMRACVLEVMAGQIGSGPHRLGQEPPLTFWSFEKHACDVAKRNNLLPLATTAFDKANAELCQEVVWNLLSEGLLAPQMGGLPHNSPGWTGSWFRVSERGRAAIAGDSLAVHDHDGLLRSVREASRGLPSAATILDYAQEAARTHRARCFLATSVMIGVATEAAVLDAIAAYMASSLLPAGTKPPEKQGAQTSVAWLQKQIESNQKARELVKADRDLDDGLTAILAGVAALLANRNGAGHPERRSPTEAEVHGALVHLPQTIRRLSVLARLFAAHPASGGDE